MSIFNQVIAGLTGERSLRQTRDRSISAARKAYDPTVFDPQLDVARQQATQGIDEGLYRRNVLNQLFRPVDASVYGGNQAAAIAGSASVDASRAQAMGQFEGNLAVQDIAARQAGAEKVGQIQSQQLQTQSQRDAYTDMIRAEYSAEVDDRRRTLGASVAKFGIEAAGGAGAIGKVLGGKLSGGMGALKSLFGNVPELPIVEIPEAVTAGLQKGASFAQQYGDAARTFQEVGMGLGIAPELRPGQGIFGGLPTNPFTKAPVVEQKPFGEIPVYDSESYDATFAPPVVQQPTTTASSATPVATQAPSPQYVERIRQQTRPTPERSPWPTVLFEEIPRALTVGLFEELTRPNREVPASIDTYLNNPGLEERTLPFIKNDPVGYGRKLSPEVRAWFEQRHPGIFNPPRR